MEADWYIDPLGRYEGRFFDGTRWTHQVSDRGTLAFDPDWPPVARGGSAASEADYLDPPAATTTTTTSRTTTTATAATVGGVVAAGGVAAAASSASASSSGFAEDVRATTSSTPTPAGDPVVRTSSIAESPSRQVAVVTPDPPTERAAASTAVRSTPRPADPLVRDPLEEDRGSGRRWLYVIGGLLLLAGLALALLPRLFGGDDGIADSDTPAAQVVQDDGDSASGDTGTETGDEVAVGAVTIRNGQSTLAGLADQHRDQVTERGINLPNDADCWFAKQGDVAEQAAFCGPVGVDSAGRTLYDQFAVVFDEAGPQIVSASVDFDSMIPSVGIDKGRELVDRDGEVIIGGPTAAPKRGERILGDF